MERDLVHVIVTMWMVLGAFYNGPGIFYDEPGLWLQMDPGPHILAQGSLYVTPVRSMRICYSNHHSLI